MKRKWRSVRSVFEPEGSLRDIYIRDVTLVEWAKLIDHLNTHYCIKFGDDKRAQIDKEYVINHLSDDTRSMEHRLLIIALNNINVHCNYSVINEIEFDIDPKEINSIEDFESIEAFMISVSRTLKKKVILTGEADPEYPIYTVDFELNINKLFGEREPDIHASEKNFLPTKVISLAANFLKRIFPL